MVKERQTVAKLLGMFMGNPTLQEAEVFGSLMFSDDVLEDKGQPIAVPMTKEELREHHLLYRLLVMMGIRRGKQKESAWYEGSVVRQGDLVRYHLIQHTLYKYIRFLGKTCRFQEKLRRKENDD